ncbi:hypothetical protein VTJ04DRAFT_7060 [Mycothermus thermophilus]|uniref:uncharacterized protein n=1 Tax=Humicola insolens TaxID=85995 RepID=UPI0037430D6F
MDARKPMRKRRITRPTKPLPPIRNTANADAGDSHTAGNRTICPRQHSWPRMSSGETSNLEANPQQASPI